MILRAPDMPAHVFSCLRALWRALLASALFVLAAGSAAMSASSTTVVSLSVPSATSLVNQCEARRSWDLGVVLPGSSARTATDADVCRFSFGSTNDTASLRLAQTDGVGTAMQAPAAGGPNHAIGTIDSIDSLDSTNLWAIAGTRVGRSTDGGASWSLTTPFASTMRDVAALGGNAAVVVGNAGEIRTTTDGTAWTPRASGVAVNLHAVDRATATVMYAAGGNGTVIRSDDGGATWGAPLPTGTTVAINDLAAADADHVYAAGTGGWALSTSDGGATWNVQQVCTTSNCGLQVAIAANTTTAWVAGGGNGVGRTYMTTDGGTTWQNRSASNGMSNGTWHAGHAWSTTDLVLMGGGDGGGRIARSSDGGSSWTVTNGWEGGSTSMWARPAVGSYVLAGESYSIIETTDDGVTWTRRYGEGGRLVDVARSDANTFVAVGYWGEIWTSVDRGATWSRRTSGVVTHLRSVTAAPDGRFVAVGDDGVVLTSDDDGASWTERPSPTALQLSGVAADVEAGGAVIAVGDAGTIIRSLDAGTSWSIVASGTAADLHAVTVWRERRAWAVGASGTIRASVDEGASWTGQSSGTTDTLVSVDAASSLVAYATSSGRLLRTTDATTWLQRSTSGASSIDAVGEDVIWRTYNSIRTDRSTDGGLTFGNSNTVTSDGIAGAAVDSNQLVLVGGETKRWRIEPVRSIADHDAGTSWTSGVGTSMFGACLQALGGDATAGSWTVDATGVANHCEASDADAWYAVPMTPVTIARTTVNGASGSADLVFGMRASETQQPGHYSATMDVVVIAPGT